MSCWVHLQHAVVLYVQWCRHITSTFVWTWRRHTVTEEKLILWGVSYNSGLRLYGDLGKKALCRKCISIKYDCLIGLAKVALSESLKLCNVYSYDLTRFCLHVLIISCPIGLSFCLFGHTVKYHWWKILPCYKDLSYVRRNRFIHGQVDKAQGWPYTLDQIYCLYLCCIYCTTYYFIINTH